MNLAQWLACGNSQTQLAALSGLNASTICRILSGKGGCTLHAALLMDKATNGAIDAESMLPPDQAALVAHLRGTARAALLRGASLTRAITGHGHEQA